MEPPLTLARLRAQRAAIVAIAAARGACNLRVFGSVARGEARPDSDVDLLVELEDGHTLFDQVHLIDGLTDLLGRQVEAVTLCASDQPATWPALVSG